MPFCAKICYSARTASVESLRRGGPRCLKYRQLSGQWHLRAGRWGRHVLCSLWTTTTYSYVTGSPISPWPAIIDTIDMIHSSQRQPSFVLSGQWHLGRLHGSQRSAIRRGLHDSRLQLRRGGSPDNRRHALRRSGVDVRRRQPLIYVLYV